MSEKESVGDRFSINVFKIRSDPKAAFASTNDLGKISFEQPVADFATQLSQQGAYKCNEAKRLLSAASYTYSRSAISPEYENSINKSLKQKAENLCSK